MIVNYITTVGATLEICAHQLTTNLNFQTEDFACCRLCCPWQLNEPNFLTAFSCFGCSPSMSLPCYCTFSDSECRGLLCLKPSISNFISNIFNHIFPKSPPQVSQPFIEPMVSIPTVADAPLPATEEWSPDSEQWSCISCRPPATD